MRNNKGVILLELMVVFIIIILLTGITISKLMGTTEKLKEKIEIEHDAIKKEMEEILRDE